MATTRKTAKYYREELVKTQNYTTLENLIKEVISKFGNKYKEINLHNMVEFNWNHRVEGFSIASNGRVLVKVYWQGDSTDGDDFVYFTDVLRKGTEVIRAQHEWLGDRTYCKHGDIRVEKDEVMSLVAELSKWLSPTEIKARKISAEISAIKNEISSKMGNDYYRQYASRWGKNEKYYNGRSAVNELIKQLGKDILKIEKEKLFEIIDKVFLSNYKDDYYFEKDWNGVNQKAYNLSY